MSTGCRRASKAMLNPAKVKRLIRDRGTKQFLTPTGTWSPDHTAARVFANDEAIRQARDEFRLKGCELYYLVGDAPSQLDFTLAMERF